MARNRTSFRPGRAWLGNAKGRPQTGDSLAEKIRAKTRNGEDLVAFYLEAFRKGSMRYRLEAAEWLTERGFGKPPQVVEHTGEDGTPIKVTVTWGEDAA